MTTSQRRAAAKREQITTAARQLFLEHGYAGTSMDAVVAEAGISKQTLYRYFPSKLDLFAAFLLSEFPSPDAFPTAMDATSPAELRAVLVDTTRTFTSLVMRPDVITLLRILLGEVFRMPELRELLRHALPEEIIGRVAGLLARADARGVISAPRPDLAARMLVGPIVSFVALDGLWRTDPPVPPSVADLEYIVDAFLTSVAVDR